MRAAVAGAGIAGLAAAVALARRGIDVDVFERAPRLKEIGAGIQLSPNAVAVLERLGVAAAIARHAAEPVSLDIYDGVSGARLTAIPLGETAVKRYGAPYWLVHRADLQSALLAAARSDRRISLHFACEARDLRPTDAGVIVTAAAREFRAGLFVAADGVHSGFRTGFFGHPGPHPTGKTAWRASLPASRVPRSVKMNSTGLWLAPGAHLVHYPIRAGDVLNIVVIAGESASSAPPLQCFGAALRPLIDAVAEWMRWPLLEVDPALPWSRGRAVLVGDAAHAMLPSGAQGGAQALEDGWLLAEALAAHSNDATRALAAFERVRRGRVERIARQSRRNLAIYNLDGFKAQLRNAALRRLPARLHLMGLDWLYTLAAGSKFH